MKYKLFFVFIIILTGCANKEEAAKELIDYNNNVYLTVQKIKDDMSVMTMVDLTEAEEGSNEEAAVFTEEQILPQVKELIDYLESVEPDNKDVIKLHELKLEAEKHAYKTVQNMIEYYRGDLDDRLFTEESKELKEKYDEFLKEREKLMEKYDVVFDEDSDTGYGMRIKLKEEE